MPILVRGKNVREKKFVMIKFGDDKNSIVIKFKF